jgi:tRNA threonylcarbamoyladenosine biosynthesis protein TsaB
MALYSKDGQLLLAEKFWESGRSLASDLLAEIKSLVLSVQEQSSSTNFTSSLSGIVVLEGPGSFTGLRIGITTANTLAYALSIPIVGTSDTVQGDWLTIGISRLKAGQNDSVVLPLYGAEANITLPKK